MDFERVRRGEISVERFKGQTLIYFPEEMVDPIPKFTIRKIVKEYFSAEELRKVKWKFGKYEYDDLKFYYLELPRVIDFGELVQPRFTIPDTIAQRVQAEYERLKGL